MMDDFRKKLGHLINRESQENGSDTPDFILAEYLCACLAAFDRATKARTDWYTPAKPHVEAPDDGKAE